MFSTTSIILCFTFLNFLVLVQCALELPAEDNYGIVVSEWAIRNTVNNLFSTLKLKVLQQKLKLKQYSTIHNFFVSITLRDHDNLKKIAKLTHVDNIDNGTQIFITQLNEVLNEDNKSDEATDSVYVTILIEDFLSRLDNLKQRNGLKNNMKFDLNKAILRYFSNNENEFGNITYLPKEFVKVNASDDVVLSSNEFWQPSSRRIFDGKSSNIDRFPFMVSVQFFKKFQCGGSIIKSDLVITSASCLQIAWNNRFFRENPAFLSVQVGSTYYERGGENIPILEIEFHPGFNPNNLRHNLALMRLTRNLKFKQKKRNLKKIDFDRHPSPLPTNTDGIVVVGWGSKTLSNKVEINWKNELSYSTLDFYPLDECQDIYTKEFVTDRNFCAGFFSKGGGACNHDAGGPGVSSGILIGVISFGSPQCGTPDAPTVFTKLGYYTDWIEKIMEMKVVTGRQPTTKRLPNFNPTISYDPLTTKIRLKITPIVHGKKPLMLTPIPESHVLRVNDKKPNFRQFLKTIFNKNKQPIKQREQGQEQEEERQEETEEGQEQEEERQEETEEGQEQEEERQEETEEVTEKEVDKTQDEKEVEKVKPKQALRNIPETEMKKEDKEKNTWTTESQSHSEENWNDKTTTTIRPCTIFGSKKAKVTLLHDNSDGISDEITSYEKLTPSFKQRNDENIEGSASQKKEFDDAIDSLLDNLNVNYIMESKENLSVNPQRIAKDRKFSPNLTDESKNKGKKPSSVVENQNLNANEEDEIDANNGSVIEGDTGEDERDVEDGTNEYENNEQKGSDNKSVEITDRSSSADNVESHSNDNHEIKYSEEVVYTVNKNNEMKDYETDDGGETDEEFEPLNIPAESLEQKKSTSNSTDRRLDMLDYEDLYKLLSEHSNG